MALPRTLQFCKICATPLKLEILDWWRAQPCLILQAAPQLSWHAFAGDGAVTESPSASTTPQLASEITSGPQTSGLEEAAADEAQRHTCGLCQGRLGVPMTSAADRQFCMDLLQPDSHAHRQHSGVEWTESVYEVPAGQYAAGQGCPYHRVYIQSAHRELRVATALASHAGLVKPGQDRS